MAPNSSELVLNEDGSIYHLHLHPEEIAKTIITVGDPERVDRVSRYFDSIEIRKSNREFTTHTGNLGGKRISVISTGIGTDNIDIVLNELDALVNFDFGTRTVKPSLTQLDIVRIGTSGSIQPEIPLGSFLLSQYAMGLDNLLHFYKSDHVQDKEMQKAFMNHVHWPQHKSPPYVVPCHGDLVQNFDSIQIFKGITVTNAGFYGPQGRTLRLKPRDREFNSKMASFRYRDLKITNLEMETAGIYGLSQLLGHRAVSLNCILANRSTGKFSKNPILVTDKLIQYVLERLSREK